MLYMQISDPNVCLQVLNWEYQTAPTRDLTYAIMGANEELNQNLTMATQFYKLSNHPLATQRYLAIHQLQALSYPNNNVQIYTFHNLVNPSINISANNATQQNTIGATVNGQPVSVKKRAKPLAIPECSVTDITPEMAMILKKLYEFHVESPRCQHQKINVIQELDMDIETLNATLRKCRKRGLVNRWPNISYFGINMLNKYNHYRAVAAVRSPEKTEVAKALLHMRELQQERNRRASEANPAPVTSAQDKMRIRNILN